MDHEVETLTNGEGHCFYPCALHGTHLVVGLVVVQAGIEHLNVAYSFTMLLGGGGYFLRMIFAARVLIARHAVPLDRPGTQRQQDLAEEFLIMCEPKFADKEQTARMQEARKKFLRVFNGGFILWVTTKSFGHNCDGPTCCKDWEETLSKMVEAVISYFLACRPQAPALARWTLIAPALKFQLRLWGFHSLLPRLLDAAFESITAKLMVDVDKADATTRTQQAKGFEIEPDILTQFHWHAANGKRLKTCKVYCLIVSRANH
jgi:hypothetical protein